MANAEGLRLATFQVDATPGVGEQMAYDPVKAVGELELSCRGVVLMGMERPIVLCAVDWIGIGNDGHRVFREALAKAAGTDADRVALHALHQHDAPRCDFSAEQILKEAEQPTGAWDGAFAREVITRAAVAVEVAVGKAVLVSHMGWGEAEVREVASSRRLMGPGGRIRAIRLTTTKDVALRAEPEGVIDPVVSVLSFWNGEKPLAVLSYYACHPQSYYRTGMASPDFPGIARFMRGQSVPAALQVHFNGAGGNVGAGKYNDGNFENRVILAQRLADGMKRAWEATEKTAIGVEDVGWENESLKLDAAEHIREEALKADMMTEKGLALLHGASRLAWLRRCQKGEGISVPCLRVGSARVLHMPGELFVEYQLAAKAMRPDLKVAMAAYGDYGPTYIGLARSYAEGGYETRDDVSNVGPEAEEKVMGVMKKLLGKP
ncbi:hypothetical protein FEM03_03845 [Phragmitibacter flavus]|uniref:Neutral/alkaline non-lysosomal ceramidase N-terminal domain-containing protein n=2 Tax=Phragmitibacter flavus TaxID=2576071 RepID=A0A5R8KJM0_9BACT|nr:hypothetical protein FEM03_03845 [Phragmitibacter flavus]